jgi:thioredoxin-like negative regulator of GroEL
MNDLSQDQLNTKTDKPGEELEGQIERITFINEETGYTVAKVNVDDSPEITAKMRIRGIPTLALFQDGDVIAQHAGAGSLSQLRTFVKGHL